MTPETLLNAKRDEILHICAKYGARNVRVFGPSHAAKRTSRAISTFSSTSNLAEPSLTWGVSNTI